MRAQKFSQKDRLLKFYWLLSAQFGIDPRTTLRAFGGVVRYVRDFLRFRANYVGRLELVPCLHDWNEEGGSTKNEYFWQDLLVARKVFTANPERHVDIGSRVDGFISHLASFREIEVFDVRVITAQIPGVIFKQADFTKSIREMEGYCDSLSCLHALEHFGLGRYGEPIDPDGYKRGLTNMASLLRAEGVLYLSVPIGFERVEFNANRVFDPRVIIGMALKNSLQLISLTVIRQGSIIELGESDEEKLFNLAMQRYALGVFIFKKTVIA